MSILQTAGTGRRGKPKAFLHNSGLPTAVSEMCQIPNKIKLN